MEELEKPQAWSTRLSEVIAEMGITTYQLGKLLGAKSIKTAYDIVAGKNKPGFENLSIMHEKLRINLNWLVSGEGEKYILPKNDLPNDKYPNFIQKKILGSQNSMDSHNTVLDQIKKEAEQTEIKHLRELLQAEQRENKTLREMIELLKKTHQ
jgi:hypothetical protein